MVSPCDPMTCRKTLAEQGEVPDFEEGKMRT